MVIAIIGLLSSVVLASLNGARAKAKDATIKAELNQFATLLELDYQDSGSYCQLGSTAWTSLYHTCDNAFSGTYADKASQICKVIYDNANSDPQYRFYSGTSGDCHTAWILMVPLNDGKWYCVGSSGAKGEYSDYTGKPGCWNNP